MYRRSVALATSAEHDARVHRDGVRYSWRVEVRIELLRLEREALPAAAPLARCRVCGGAGTAPHSMPLAKCPVCRGAGRLCLSNTLRGAS
jgi:hypothetical protein